ncbi:MAG TPA: hypothetical protein VGR69_10085, partial [Candidatus Rubrimentiphilum sp.]|nr:hypothetical protein [Candidatus Rubrimentiphilum sp.]
MIRITRVAASVAVIGMLTTTLPAQAAMQYFTQAKLIKRADTNVPIAGPGTVVIQVLVNADGSHRVTHVIRSTNPGDNEAAIDIAVHSTYRPQHRGNTPVTGFYDFTIKFTGKSTASSGSKRTGVVASGGNSQLDAMIRAGNYAQAKARAEQLLASNPNNALLNEQLGTADFFLKDYAAAAAAFDKVPTISRTYLQVAAQSYALATEQLAQSDTSTAVAYGQKAVALAPSGGTYYALGAAELQAGNTSAAIADQPLRGRVAG